MCRAPLQNKEIGLSSFEQDLEQDQDDPSVSILRSCSIALLLQSLRESDRVANVKLHLLGQVSSTEAA